MCKTFWIKKEKLAFRKAPLNLVIHLLVLVTVVVIETIISSGSWAYLQLPLILSMQKESYW